MKILTNQTLYQCDYCGKRLLTKRGAKLHEEEYCGSSPIVEQKKLDVIRDCKHQMREVYMTMPGEPHLQQPSHDECINCGVTDRELRRMEQESMKL